MLERRARRRLESSHKKKSERNRTIMSEEQKNNNPVFENEIRGLKRELATAKDDEKRRLIIEQLELRGDKSHSPKSKKAVKA